MACERQLIQFENHKYGQDHLYGLSTHVHFCITVSVAERGDQQKRLERIGDEKKEQPSIGPPQTRCEKTAEKHKSGGDVQVPDHSVEGGHEYSPPVREQCAPKHASRAVRLIRSLPPGQK